MVGKATKKTVQHENFTWYQQSAQKGAAFFSCEQEMWPTLQCEGKMAFPDSLLAVLNPYKHNTKVGGEEIGKKIKEKKAKFIKSPFSNNRCFSVNNVLDTNGISE